MTTAVSPNEVLDRRRAEIRVLLAAHRLTEAGVFGSIARDEGAGISDLDIIVAFRSGVCRDPVRITISVPRPGIGTAAIRRMLAMLTDDDAQNDVATRIHPVALTVRGTAAPCAVHAVSEGKRRE